MSLTQDGGDFEFDPDKFRAVICFFVSDGEVQSLGKTKLMKLLYYADFDHFEQYDSPITNATYKHMPHGPVPEQAESILRALEAENVLKIGSTRNGDFDQETYEWCCAPDFSCLTKREYVTLKAVADRWRAHSARQIVAASHGEPPWAGVDDFAIIPYELAYYRNTFGDMDLEDDEREAMGLPVGAARGEWL